MCQFHEQTMPTPGRRCRSIPGLALHLWPRLTPVDVKRPVRRSLTSFPYRFDYTRPDPFMAEAYRRAREVNGG